METLDEVNGVLVTIGRGGWTVKRANERHPDGRLKSTGRISGYGSGWDKYISTGTPIVDTRTIPQDKILKWSLQSPMVNPDLRGVRGAKVEQSLGSFGKEEMQVVDMMHPTMRAMAKFGNLEEVSVEEFVILAEEWGATVRYHE